MLGSNLRFGTISSPIDNSTMVMDEEINKTPHCYPESVLEALIMLTLNGLGVTFNGLLIIFLFGRYRLRR